MNRNPLARTMLSAKTRGPRAVVMMVVATVAITAAFAKNNYLPQPTRSKFLPAVPSPTPKNEGYGWIEIGSGVQFKFETNNVTAFLADPVGNLRQQGVAVPESAERHWRALTVALRGLTKSQAAKPASRDPHPVEELSFTFDKITVTGVVMTITSNGNADSTSKARAGARRGKPEMFLADPINTLRAHGVDVPTADERFWKQLANALNALGLAYSNSGARVDRQNPVNSELPGARVVTGTRPVAKRSSTADAPATQDLATGQQPTFDRRAFDDSLHAAVAPNVMGYTFLLIKDGRVVTEGAGGLARNAADREMKMTTSTPQNMGSLFKFVTGVTMLHLLDRAPAGSAGGNNSLQTRLGAPVALLYPQLWNAGIKTPTIRTITFRHLLQHRSGFRDCSTPLGCFSKDYNTTLLGVREYENINFQLLGFLIPLYATPDLIPALNAVAKTVPDDEADAHIQLVLGDRMDRFMNQTMFGMAPGKISASCDAANEYKATGAYGYVSKSDTGKGIITSRKAGKKPCVGSGGYWMSIRDFGSFVAAALHSDRILSQQARLELYRTGMPADDRLVWSFTMSDSWISSKFKMSTIIWSNGIQPYDGGQSFNTVLLRLPLNYELMVFVNSGGMNVNSLAKAGLKAFRAGMEP